MKWKHPPVAKIYEALGAVADGRVHVSENTAKVYSSSGNKFYEVNYDPKRRAIMSNDNGSYWKGYLGYPSIAFLMMSGVVSYDSKVGDLLKDVPWKDINQEFKNDFDKALEHILSSKSAEERAVLRDFVHKVDGEIKELQPSLLGKKILPPGGY